MNSETLLSDGIMDLRRNDTNIDRIIAPRSEEIISLLSRYLNEIELFNHVYGLVGTENRESLVIRHILDSLAPLGIISRLLNEVRGARIADAGSGAGLPGIPLAVVLSACDFTLIERMGKRANFLWNTKASLGLPNVTIEEKELEKTDGLFDLVIFRAFKPLEPKLLAALFKICVHGGAIAAYKGRREKIEKEIAPLEKTLIHSEVIPYNAPFLNEERHLLVIRR